ncbi:MAG: response regulator transcription factor [Bacillota bacterium]|nr:response regulator transcription factor [Bacillota bacterium]
MTAAAPESGPARILVVDDDVLAAGALATIVSSDPGLEVVAVGHSAADAVRLHAELAPDLAVLDIRMGDSSGIDAARAILARDPGALILFLTTFLDDEYIISALALGARGYILKQDHRALIPAIHAVLRGQTVYGLEVTGRLARVGERPAQELDALYEERQITERERAVIVEVAAGCNNREIADRLYLSEGTVRNQISVILEKLDLRDRTQLAIHFWQHGGRLPERKD